VLLQTPASAGPGELLKSVKEQLRGVPNKGQGYGLLRYLGPEAIRASLDAGPAASVSFNYVGQVDRGFTEQSALLRVAQESPGAEWAPAGARPYAVDVTGRIAGGRLRIAIHYSENLNEREAMEGFAEAYLASLQELIRHCLEPGAGGCTPSDFPLADTTQPVLDTLSPDSDRSRISTRSRRHRKAWRSTPCSPPSRGRTSCSSSVC
jgi:non-ribosomal peptide synthase protein (TIGR01720 family)